MHDYDLIKKNLYHENGDVKRDENECCVFWLDSPVVKVKLIGKSFL